MMPRRDSLRADSGPPLQATFLVVAANGGKGQIENNETGYPAIIKRMYADGHQIGSHTWSHQDLTAITAQERRDQIIKNEIALVDIIGVIPTYFRPTYTRFNADVLADLKTFGYHVVSCSLSHFYLGPATRSRLLLHPLLTWERYWSV